MPGHETPQLAPAGATPVRCRPRFPSRNRRFPDRCRSPDCASTAFRCRCLLLRQKLFVLLRRRLRNNYILCPTGTPTFAALRRQRRDLIIATRPAHQPLPSLLSAAAAQEVQAIPRTDNVPRRTNSAKSAPPILHDLQRAKGPLDRRSKRLSFPHFFLRRKKCGRRRPPPRQGKIDSPPQRRNSPNPVEANTPTVAGQAVAEASAPVNVHAVLLTDSDDRCTPPASAHRQICTCPPRAKGSLDRRSKWFSLVTFF